MPSDNVSKTNDNNTVVKDVISRGAVLIDEFINMDPQVIREVFIKYRRKFCENDRGVSTAENPNKALAILQICDANREKLLEVINCHHLKRTECYDLCNAPEGVFFADHVAPDGSHCCNFDLTRSKIFVLNDNDGKPSFESIKLVQEKIKKIIECHKNLKK